MIADFKEKVLLHYRLILEETGGLIGVRDEGLLESALASPFMSFGGRDLYPAKEQKAARLGFSLISNHPFMDGNKRVGMHEMLTFLEMNGIYMSCSVEDVIITGRAVADGKMKYEDLLNWIYAHEIK